MANWKGHIHARRYVDYVHRMCLNIGALTARRIPLLGRMANIIDGQGIALHRLIANRRIKRRQCMLHTRQTGKLPPFRISILTNLKS